MLPTVAFMVCNSLPTAVTSTTTLLPPTCRDILMVVAWPMLTVVCVLLVENPCL